MDNDSKEQKSPRIPGDAEKDIGLLKIIHGLMARHFAHRYKNKKSNRLEDEDTQLAGI